MLLTEETKQKAITLYDDVYGKGHGKEMTVSRYVSVLGLTSDEAYRLFDAIDQCVVY